MTPIRAGPVENAADPNRRDDARRRREEQKAQDDKAKQEAALKKFLTEMISKLQHLRQGKCANSQNALKGNLAALQTVLDKIPIEKESEFFETMRKIGGKVAGKQKEVKSAMALLKEEDPSVDSEAAAIIEAGKL